MNSKTVVKKPKVFWRPAEATAVAVKALRSLNANNEKTYIEALMNAQALVLAPDRQRPKTTLQTQTKILRELAVDAIKKEDAAERRETERREVDRLAAEQATGQHVAEESVLVSPPIDFIQFNIDDMVGHVAARYKAALIEALRIATEEAFHEVEDAVNVRATDSQLTPTVTTKKPKVVVCGYRGDQGAYISNALKASFNIEIIPSTDGLSPKRLGEAAEHADFVLFNGKFSNHAQQNQVRQHAGLIQFNGGVTACIKRLQELAKTGK